MENPPTSPESDIAQERYSGPNALVSGLGASALVHTYMAVIGLAVGGAAGYYFDKEGKFAGKIREKLTTAIESPSLPLSLVGKTFNLFLKFGEDTAKLVLSPFEKKIQSPRVTSAIDSGIIASTVALIGGMFVGGGRGISAAIRGKKQFERAQAEVIDLREKNDTLQSQLATSEAQLEDYRTAEAAKKGKLHVAVDGPPHDPSLPPATEQPPHLDAEPRHAAALATPASKWATGIKAQKELAGEMQLG